MISVAPEVPPVSVHQCQLPVLNSTTCQCHINATYQCPSELPFSASQCHLSMPISAAYQCHILVLPFSAHQCFLISAAYQCPSL
ncbi:unnamed protein product, partial [Staurois parvus]